jgi:hypothetical protein
MCKVASVTRYPKEPLLNNCPSTAPATLQLFTLKTNPI